MTLSSPHFGGASACSCKECGPGPGTDYRSKHRLRTQARNLRLGQLLGRDNLTPDEEAELDSLLAEYIHG